MLFFGPKCMASYGKSTKAVSATLPQDSFTLPNAGQVIHRSPDGTLGMRTQRAEILRVNYSPRFGRASKTTQVKAPRWNMNRPNGGGDCPCNTQLIGWSYDEGPRKTVVMRNLRPKPVAPFPATARLAIFLCWMLALPACSGRPVPAPPTPTALPQTYSLTLLPPLPGASDSQAQAINNNGAIAGYSMINGQAEATQWVNAQPTDLGPGFAVTINDSGAMAGFMSGPGGNNQNEALFWASSSSTAVAIPTLTGFDASVASGIDADGTVVGIAFESFDPSQEEAWEWTPHAGITAIPQLLEAFAISKGKIVGIGTNFDATVVTVAAGTPTSSDLGVGGDALGISSLGSIAGFTSGNVTQAFLSQGGTLTLLGTGNTALSTAYGINAQDVVVGFVEQPEGATRLRRTGTIARLDPPVGANVFAMAWTKSDGIVQLSSRVPPQATWTLNYANGINDKGQIVGTASSSLPDGTLTTEGFVLDPQ
jgi:uncharacterized membrane protein